jgi:purine-nucleoside phosphorylase
VAVVLGTGIGLRPDLEPGALVLLDDQINLTGGSPLVGPNRDDLGPRFPDMSEPFDRELRDAAARVAQARGIPLARGVYVGVAEADGSGARVPAPDPRTFDFLREIGADLVGTDIVHPVIAARHMGMPVLGIAAAAGSGPPAEGPVLRLVRDVVELGFID